MSLTPLISAPFAIQLHALAALALIPLTIAIFSLPRGSRLHKRLGWAWVLLMAAVAVSSFAIHEIRLWGGFSPIHLLSLFSLVSLLGAILAIRRRNIRRHRAIMLGLVWGALIGAGAFTLLPGRIMHEVLLAGL